jgi:mono/diheme cytochrome c family protein
MVLPDGRSVPVKRFVFNTAAPVTVDPVVAGSATTGKALYASYCLTCHGRAAQNRDKVLLGANQPTVILNAITANRGGMALLQGIITSKDASDLAAYLETPFI